MVESAWKESFSINAINAIGNWIQWIKTQSYMKFMHLFYIDILVFQAVKQRVILVAVKFVRLHKIYIKDNKYGQQENQVHLIVTIWGFQA